MTHHGLRCASRRLRALAVARGITRGITLGIALLLPVVAVATEITLPTAGGTALRAHWLPVAGDAAPRPVVIALHGCGGLYRRDGKTFDARYPDAVARLHAAGFHVLLPDSFGSRGAGPICAIRNAERSITVETRRDDAIAAVAWAAAQPQVDARRIVLLGWSHGAMTTLSAINAARATHAQPLAAAVAFYPGCTALLKEAFRLDMPLLLLLGEKDDWTPPAGCEKLVARTRQAQPAADLTLRVYADSYHGFDGTGPVRFRADVPNGVDRSGVHVGGNPAARAAALDELARFLARVTAP
jgi:dienelactone hydrolase